MKNLILDGNNISFKAYHIPRIPKIVNDVNISPILQFFVMLKSYINIFKPSSIYIAWDKKLNENYTQTDNFRKTLVSYKENRPDRTDIMDIYDCIDVISNLSTSMGIKNMYPWNLEADDVIYFLSKSLSGENVIVSSDKDLLQLVDENTICYNTSKNQIIDESNFFEITGVDKDNFILYKSILGDKSDNIQGLDRYGEVKSKKLANNFDKSLLDENQLSIIERNIQIMDLSKGIEQSSDELHHLEKQLNSVKNIEFNETEFRKICNRYELYPILRDLDEWKQNITNRSLLNDWFSVTK